MENFVGWVSHRFWVFNEMTFDFTGDLTVVEFVFMLAGVKVFFDAVAWVVNRRGELGGKNLPR